MKMKDEENEREKVTDKEAEKYLYLKRIRISNTSGIDAMPGTSPDIERRRKSISGFPTCILTLRESGLPLLVVVVRRLSAGPDK